MTSDKSAQLTGLEKVINLQRFRSGKSLSPIRQAEAYWTALRDGDNIPKRTEIDPRGLSNLLEYAFILERIAPGIARFRLAGQHLTRLAGIDVRGVPVTTFFTPASRASISEALEHTFETPSITEMTLAIETRYGRPPAEAQMILLPLKNDLGEINRALGLLVCDTDTFAGPSRFDVLCTSCRAISGLQYTLPVVPEPSAPVTGFAQPARPIGTPFRHLRLVKND